MNTTHSVAKLISKALLLASMQSAWGSVEMSSKFSVLSFGKDQDTLQRAADALKSYILIGTIWAIGTMLTLYATYSWQGVIAGFIANALLMGWIIISYMQAFRQAATRYNLEIPTLYSDMIDIYSLIGVATVGILLFAYMYQASK